jgi:hypothetical protein
MGCGVTVTDWRLYTADHRHIDGGGNQPRKKGPTLQSLASPVFRSLWISRAGRRVLPHRVHVVAPHLMPVSAP